MYLRLHRPVGPKIKDLMNVMMIGDRLTAQSNIYRDYVLYVLLYDKLDYRVCVEDRQ